MFLFHVQWCCVSLSTWYGNNSNYRFNISITLNRNKERKKEVERMSSSSISVFLARIWFAQILSEALKVPVHINHHIQL